MSDNHRGILAALVEQARKMAEEMAGDPDQETACHFCGSGVPLWESLLVTQLCGVPAHVQCPEDKLLERLKESGPVPEFGYEDFARAVDARLTKDAYTVRSGVISGS